MFTVSEFSQMALHPTLLKTLNDIGYETPSPIQAQTIPLLLEGRDVLGQAQTGTGKTAAFALPLLSRLDMKQKLPQILVLTPTRELAIQVAEAFQKYAHGLPGFHVLPIYGGQDYRVQIKALQRGVQVVVGTPGRVMDHMRKATLQLGSLQALVLDEADEMLRMGFIDDVEWILEQAPVTRQTALFSATMPPQVSRIAWKHLKDPAEVTIRVQTVTAETVRQRYWLVNGLHKLDALTRILEAEPSEGVIIFVRTKVATIELSEKLQARGYAVAALSGDIAQKQREQTIRQIKSGKIDVLVATDVAARGLDVNRISHVINYDIPYDVEAYIHRIGRTGRAGRHGEAILFVSPRETRLLKVIERATRQKISLMKLPSPDDINTQRINRFKQKITETLEQEDLTLYLQIIEQYRHDHQVLPQEIAAALARLLQGDAPLLLSSRSGEDKVVDRSRPERPEVGEKVTPTRKRTKCMTQRYRVAVGHQHGLKPAQLVAVLVQEGGIDSRAIGDITIREDYSWVELSASLPGETLRHLKRVSVSGKTLQLSAAEDSENTYLRESKPRRQRKPRKFQGH